MVAGRLTAGRRRAPQRQLGAVSTRPEGYGLGEEVDRHLTMMGWGEERFLPAQDHHRSHD